MRQRETGGILCLSTIVCSLFLARTHTKKTSPYCYSTFLYMPSPCLAPPHFLLPCLAALAPQNSYSGKHLDHLTPAFVLSRPLLPGQEAAQGYLLCSQMQKRRKNKQPNKRKQLFESLMAMPQSFLCVS